MEPGGGVTHREIERRGLLGAVDSVTHEQLHPLFSSRRR